MSFCMPTDDALVLNTVLDNMGFSQSISLSRLSGKAEPYVAAERMDDMRMVKIYLCGQELFIDAVDYEPFTPETDFELLQEIEKELKAAGVTTRRYSYAEVMMQHYLALQEMLKDTGRL